MLDFIKQIRQSEIYFPFFAHADTSLIEDIDHFRVRLSKVANAILMINQDNPLTYQVKSSAIKSGSRFVDEMAVLTKVNLSECNIEVEDKDAAVKKKESLVKATFKIEINDEEKRVRDSTTTNVYHTGTNQITISSDDMQELEMDRKRMIDEGVIKEDESQDEDDGDDDDDPDDDLDF